MTVKFSNNASGTLASSITATTTTITLTTGQGALFPSLATGEFFFATLVNSSNALEIVKVTARATDVLTVTRGQDGTIAKSYTGGDKLELRPVAASLAAILQDAKDYSDGLINAHISNPTGAHAASAIGNIPAGTIASTNVQAALNELDAKKAIKTVTLTGAGAITGGGDLSANRTFDLTPSGATAGSYGSATTLARVTVDAQGRITSAQEFSLPAPTVLTQTTYATNVTQSINVSASNRPVQVIMHYSGIQGGNATISVDFQWGLGGLTNTFNCYPAVGVNYVVDPSNSMSFFLTPTTATTIQFRVNTQNLNNETFWVSAIQL